MDQETFIKIQRALAEPKRMEILQAIRDEQVRGEVTCSLILERFTVSQSTFSHHLNELTGAGLVDAEKQGRNFLLRVNEDVVADYLIEIKSRLSR